jgi:tRNA-specific adenosine deaminase 3
MALALGLGSLFNHSETPNVSYTLDPFTESIRYTTTKLINPDEEMCIFYGHNLWFEPVGSCQRPQRFQGDTEDGWGGLSAVLNDVEVSRPRYPTFLDGDADEIIPVEDLPFTRLKVTRDEDEEEELSAVRTSKLLCTSSSSTDTNHIY